MAFFFKPKTPTNPTVITPPVTTSIDSGRSIPPDDPAIERRIIDVGTEFLDLARSGKAGLLNAAFWSDKLMDWAMQDGDRQLKSCCDATCGGVTSRAERAQTGRRAAERGRSTVSHALASKLLSYFPMRRRKD